MTPPLLRHHTGSDHPAIAPTLGTGASLPYRFHDERNAVVITEPRLPQPWINYLSNGTLHAFVSQAGGGLLWWRSPLTTRITRYRQYNLPIDSPGFYLYLREADGTVWSPTWRPAETPLDSWSAEHRPGRTRFHASRGALEATLELFIPPGENVLVWDVILSNRGGPALALDVFAYAEFSLLDWRSDTEWACYVKHNLQVTWDDALEGLVYLYRHFHFNPNLAACPLVHFSSTLPVASWSGDRDRFVGNYRDERNPVQVEAGVCESEPNLCGDPAGALHVPLLVQPGLPTRFQFFLAAEPSATSSWPASLEAARATAIRLRTPGTVDRLSTALDRWWADHLGAFHAAIPDPDLARQINVWTPVQCVHTGRYSRSISQHASGIRTLGYRDTCQDMLALTARQTDLALATWRYLIGQQYPDGHTPHQCNPVERQPADPGIHIDNPLWLVMLTYALVAETGRLELLEEIQPWLSPVDNLSALGGDTVWTHLLRIVDFMEANAGAHGLPLIHKGDWNDSIGKFAKRGRGESIFAGQQYVYVLSQLLELARALGREKDAERIAAARARQAAAIHACAWDGRWWRRGFDDDGNPIGSESCTYGKIWLNSQTWSVIADLGSPEQNRTALDAVAELLDTRLCGIKKLHPSFASFPDVEVPYSGYSPGCGENGAIFCHANTWAVMAEALLGRAGRAWSYFRQLVPNIALRRLGLERYRAEPYAYVSNIVGPENPKFGWANVTQVTGTAAWMEVVATQYLLGLRPELGGLRIEPVLPSDWDNCTVHRRFRGCDVTVRIARVARLRCGDIEVYAGNILLPGHLVPAALLQNARLEIHVVIGAPG